MFNNKSSTSNDMIELITVIKLGSFGFILMIIINQILQYDHTQPAIIFNKQLYLLMFFIIILLISIYILLSQLYFKIWQLKNIRKIQIIEGYVFLLVSSILIMFSNSYDSDYKYLLIFGVITITLELGKKQGIIMALVSSFTLLAIDLIFAPHSAVNIYFENDLTFTSSFFVVAWVLGQYVQIERERRELLEQQLIEQLKEHENIMEILSKDDTLSNLLIENSPDAIFIQSKDRFLYANENALDLLGYCSLEELQNKTILDFEASDNIKDLELKYISLYKNEGYKISFEDTIINKKGEAVKVQNTSTYYLFKGHPSIVTVMRDIRPVVIANKLRKDVIKNIEKLNETIEENKLVTEFFSNISHELKTPLNIIFSSLQMLDLYNNSSDADIIKKKKNYILAMKQNSYRLLRLINNLLDITKYDSGYITLHMKNENIVSAVEDITMSILIYAENKGVEIIFDTETEEKIIAFDVEKIERIILNLLSNALKFTDPGGSIYITITSDENNVIISVKDTGIGIPADKKEQIFERFSQVDKSFRRNNEGTGLGLSIVKSFVTLHGGNIKLNSELGKGSEFIITLPSIQTEKINCETSEIRSNIQERINLELSDIYSTIN
ncbi:sensor histidine kinase [Clostridium folliculivorans]|uniref:histidine kinase n=1 Tax=Clostridium folliculivorans TaxID=2886038 RepID=A0A9W6DC64_9CLOT|nr:PAS domain-containing sensor histidine kinase [Clostridium folliculivorans]GKU26984.1 two-component sensor kinase [Clostridium folliculivorans]GKU29174.1 two-component sensor kinase [Clostridium folliculivorans]